MVEPIPSQLRVFVERLGQALEPSVEEVETMEPLSAIGICTLTLGTLAAALYVARREACHQRALLADHVRSATCSSDGVGIPVNLGLPLL